MKIKKKFFYDDIELKIIERDEPYMNGKEPMQMTRVMAPNGGTLPLQIQHRQTLKSIVEDSIKLLNSFKANGANVTDELTKEINH